MSVDLGGLQVNENSPEWKMIKAYCDEQIAKHQRYLEEIGTSPEETEGHRFAIATLRAILKLPKSGTIGPLLKDE